MYKAPAIRYLPQVTEIGVGRMTSRCKRLARTILLATTLGATSVMAQDIPVDILTLIELAENDKAADVVGLSGAELSAILAGANEDQRAVLMSALSPTEVDELIAELAFIGTESRVLADMVSTVISADPSETDRIISVVLQNSPAIVLPQVAKALIERIETFYEEMPLLVFEGHVLAALSFDLRVANRLLAIGNTWDSMNAAKLARAMAMIADSANETLASAIATAFALEGGQVAQFAAEFRNTLPVDDLDISAPTLPSAPVVQAAGIGGGGASSGGTAATMAKRDAIFASGTGPGTSLGSGPSFTPPERSPAVSPTN